LLQADESPRIAAACAHTALQDLAVRAQVGYLTLELVGHSGGVLTAPAQGSHFLHLTLQANQPLREGLGLEGELLRLEPPARSCITSERTHGEEENCRQNQLGQLRRGECTC